MVSIGKRKKRIIVIISVIASLVAGGVITVNTIINRKVTRLLTEQLPVGSPGASYSANLGRVRVNILNRTVSLTGFSVKANPAQNGTPSESLDFSVNRITLQGVRYNRSSKSLKINSIDIDSPYLSYSGVPYATKRKPQADTLPRKSLNDIMASLELADFTVGNARFDIAFWDKQGKRQKVTADSLTLNVGRLAIDSLACIGIDDFCDTFINVSAAYLSYTYNGGAMMLETTGLTADNGSGSIKAETVNLLPQYPKMSYASRVSGNSDWTEIRINDLLVAGIDTAELGRRGGNLTIDTLSIGRGSLASLKDRNIALSDKIKKLAYESIRSIPVPVTVKALAVRNFDFTYEEIAKGKQEPGSIVISGVNADVNGFTNIAVSKDQYITMLASGGFYNSGQGNFKTVIKIPVHKDNDRFSMHAHIDTIDAALFNSMFEKLVNVRIDSGQVGSIDFDISGDSSKASVSMAMPYRNLSIALLNKSDHSKERLFLSSIINMGVIYPSNPMKNREFRKGTGEAERDRYRSQFNYLYRIIISGVKDTALRDTADIFSN